MLSHHTTSGTGRAVVLIHGNSLDRRTWNGQITDPALAHLQLVALDLPGHGNSPWYPPERNYTLEDLAMDVAAELDGLDAPLLVGHSLGGHIALRVLALAPHVSGLVLSGTPPLSSAADFAHAFLPHPALANAFKADLSREEALALANAWTWQGSLYTLSLRDTILNTDPRVRQGIGNQLAAGDIKDEHAMIHASRIPVSMVHGTDDPFIPCSYLEALAPALFAGGKVRYIRDAGHCAQIQEPSTFNSLLAEFERSL